MFCQSLTRQFLQQGLPFITFQQGVPLSIVGFDFGFRFLTEHFLGKDLTLQKARKIDELFSAARRQCTHDVDQRLFVIVTKNGITFHTLTLIAPSPKSCMS